jgi:nucleotide-binding universal stress UspA family protein
MALEIRANDGDGAKGASRVDSLPVAGFHRVMVCLDRSEAAEAVLPLATYLARLDSAPMTLLHVLEGLPDGAAVRATDAIEWEVARQEARSYLDSLSNRAVEVGVEAQCLIAEGSAAHAVAASAAELDADLLVLSTSGESGPDAWSLGGTAQKILALGRAAMLVVPSHDRQPVPHVPPRRILVPLDGSLRGESVLPTAIRLARADRSEIVLVHVVPDPVRTEVLSTPEDLALARELADRMAARASAYLERIRSQLVAAGVRTGASVSHAADHREGLVALAAAERADLIVMSAHGSVCNPRRPFGSVTSHVIAHSSAPVLVIQDLPDRTSRVTAAPPPSLLPPRSVDAALGGA